MWLFDFEAQSLADCSLGDMDGKSGTAWKLEAGAVGGASWGSPASGGLAPN